MNKINNRGLGVQSPEYLADCVQETLSRQPYDCDELLRLAKAMQTVMPETSKRSLYAALDVVDVFIKENKYSVEATRLAAFVGERVSMFSVYNHLPEQDVRCLKLEAAKKWRTGWNRVENSNTRLALASTALQNPVLVDEALAAMICVSSRVHCAEGLESFRFASMVAMGRSGEKELVEIWAENFESMPNNRDFDKTKVAIMTFEMAPDGSILKKRAQSLLNQLKK